MRRLKRRRAGPILTVLKINRFLENWSVDMRYSTSGSIDQARCDLWRSHAKRMLYATGVSVA